MTTIERAERTQRTFAKAPTYRWVPYTLLALPVLFLVAAWFGAH